jgi:hypothetical protein
MSFGGGSDSQNNKIIKEQQREADRYKRETKETNARIKSGTDRISAIFNPKGGSYRTPGSYDKVKGQPKWNWTDGEKKSEGGLGDDFYTAFTDSLSDFYMPELARQKADAESQNLFNAGRRGTLRSSMAADAAGDLVREGAEADTRIKSDIDAQLAGLKGDVNAAKRAALSTLYSTQDPKAAANQALSEATAIQTRPANFSPLGNMFASAAEGYANYQNQLNQRRYASSIPSNNPYVGSGKAYG